MALKCIKFLQLSINYYKEYSFPPFSGRQFQSEAYEDGLQISEAHLTTSPRMGYLPNLTQGDSEGLVDFSGEYTNI